MYPLKSPYQTVTGSVELSTQVLKSAEYGSGSTYSIHCSVRGFNLPMRPPPKIPAHISPFLSGLASYMFTYGVGGAYSLTRRVFLSNFAMTPCLPPIQALPSRSNP